MSYSGSTGHEQNVQNESPPSGSTPNDDAAGSSPQDGNPPNDSRPSTPTEPVKNDTNRNLIFIKSNTIQ